MKSNIRFSAGNILLAGLTLLAVVTSGSLHIQASTCTPPPSGLVGWWPGEGNANDIIGGDNGSLQGGATVVAGKVGQGFRFDGANGFLQIPDSAALKPANVTCEAWVWLDPSLPSHNGGEQIVFKKNTWSAWFEGYSLLKGTFDNGDGTYSDRFQFCVSRYGNQVAINSQTIAQRGVWYHVAATYDGNQSKLYVNGVLEASATPGFALDYDTTPVFIGTSGTWAPYLSMFGGIIDEPSIYNRALSSNEIAAIYNAGSAGKCGSPVVPCTPAPANLVAWLQAEGNFNDSVGTNNGTEAGGVTFSTGEVGQGFNFNGSSQIKLSASPSLDVGKGGGLTLETWIRPGHITLYEPQFVFEWNDGAGNGGVHLMLSTDHNVAGDGYGNVLVDVVDTLGNSHGIFTASNAIGTNALQHVAVTYDKTSGLAVMYVNGLALASANLGSFTPQTSYDFYLGNRPSGPFAGNYFNGQLDEPSIYNRALSASEIQAIYNAGSAGKCAPAVPTNSCVTPPSGLVGWWPGEGSTSDLVGGNNGTLVGGATFAAGEVGQAFSFNGAGQYVNIPQTPSLNPGNQVTVEFWMKADSGNALNTYQGLVTSDFYDLEISNGQTGGPLGVNFAVSSTGGAGFGEVANANGGGAVISSGQWHHVAGTYDGAQVRLYIDGQPWGNSLSYSGTISPMLSNSFVTIGAEDGRAICGCNNRYFNGLIDEPSIYNRALSASEIQAIYNVGSAGKCLPVSPSLALLLNVDFGSGGARGYSLKTGFAAIGLATNDFWNFYDRDASTTPGDWRTSGALTNLQSANGAVTSVGMNASDAPGAWNDASGDPMYMVYDYPLDGGNNIVTFTNLPVGQYDVLAYSPDGNYEITVGGTSYGVKMTYDSPVSSVPVWMEGVQYAHWRNVPVAAGQPLVLTVRNGVSGYAVLSGVQILSSSTMPPSIITQPTNQTVSVAGTVNFSVAASGSLPLIYQWSVNTTNIVGATNATLTLTNIQLGKAGSYSVLVTNNYGTAASSNAQLTVNVPTIPPTILSQSPNQVVLLGNTATYSVVASGTDPLSYSWQRKGLPISGATNASYSLVNAQLSDSGSTFSCLVTNAFGSASSTNASLKVIDTIFNDLCSGAVVITNSSYTNTQSTLKASSFGDPVPDCVDGFGHGVWYQFTAPVAGLLIVDTFGSDFDTGLAIYTGSCDTPAEVACNDDSGGVTSQVNLRTTAGTTYSILAGGYGSDAGNLVLHLNHLTPPAFVVQPTNMDVIVSSNAIFRTALTGSQPIFLQWYFNGTPLMHSGHIGGPQTPTLLVAQVQTNDGGIYQLVASNIVGVVTSSVAILTPIILPPVITTQPVDQSVLIGSNVTFTATIAGTPPYYFSWSFNGTPLADDGVHIFGSGTNSLTISNLTTADAGSYMLTVTNVSGGTNSVAAVLTVLVPPSITQNPIGRSVPPGLPTTFTVAASGIPTPAYQWQLNGTNIPGSTGSSYTAAAVGTNDLGYYQVVAQNSVGSATSVVAQLTFGPVAAWGRNLDNECLPPPGLSNVVGVAGYYGVSYAVRADGTVAAWGGRADLKIPAYASNAVAISLSSGGIATVQSDGKVVSWTGLVPPILSNIVSVTIGNSFGLALRAEGTVTSWGSAPTPGFPAGLNHVTAMAAGYNNAVALKSDGTILVSGAGTVTNVPSSVTNVIAVAAGYTYAMALKANGTVVAWGSGTATNLPAGMTNIIAVSAGNYSGENFGLAVRSTGTVVAWGDNPYGETSPPAALSNLLSVAIAAAPYHGLALVNDGSPQILQPPVGLTAYTGRSVTLQGSAVGAQPLSYQWLLNGTNIPGATSTSMVISNVQFGNAGNYSLFVSNSVNTALSLAVPLTVISNNTLTFLSQPSGSQTNYQGSKVTLGATVLGSGPVGYQWYFSTNGQTFSAVAGATSDTLTLDPAFVSQSGYYRVVASNQYNSATSSSAYLRVLFAKSWGYLASDPPFNLTNATAIAVGNSGIGTSVGHYLTLKSDGKISSWGISTFGQTNFSALSNSIVTAIAAGYQDSLALKSDGTVYAAGYGIYGETNVPSGLSGVTAIACGDYHDLALKSDGTVAGWGQNTYLQTTNTAATNVVAIAAGGNNSIALRADGAVITWGQYGSGQFPIPLNATNVISVAAGFTHFLALRANGTVVGWGNNSYGQTTVPATLSNVVAISAGGNHSVALRNDGTIVTWGANYPYSFNNAAAPSDLANVVAIASGGDHDLALFGTRAPVFTVQPWNRAVASLATGVTNITLTGKCSGAQPVSYQWQLNGTNYPGATTDSLTLRGDPPSRIPVGAFQLIASNAYGVVASKYAKVTTFIPLGTALNATNLAWTTSGSAAWFGETNVTHDGVSAAQSGGIGALQETILQTTLATNWPGSCTFWWKVSSEQDFDFLEFRINGIVQTSISGEVNWQQVSIPVAAGTNVLVWRYSKDASFDFGQDAGWVDQFAYVPAGPLITLQPVSQTANMGTNVVFQVAASGPPNFPNVLRYQWWQNGSPIGPNSPVLTLNSVGRVQTGTYFVTVTNVTLSGNSTVSSNAVLHVLVPQLLGTPTLMPDGSFQLTSTDANGGLLRSSDLANFEAQASTDLVNWVTLPNALSLTNGMLLLQDTGSSNYMTRYYRIIEH